MSSKKSISRKSPSHGEHYTSSHPFILFLTFCTKDRRPWLATEENHQHLLSSWKQATAWMVGKYMIVPNHIHLFVVPGTPDVSLENWIHFWKTQFRMRHSHPEYRWQPDYWDTRMRSIDRFRTKWDYVHLNPVRHGLVKHQDDWPYQGCIFEWDV